MIYFNFLFVLFPNSSLKELCTDKANYQKEQTKSHKQTSAKSQLGQSEPKDPNNVRVIQRKLVYIVGMPNEFASEKVSFALRVWTLRVYDHDSSLPVRSFDEYEINANRMLFTQLLIQKNFLGQYGKIENIIIDNIGANQQIPDSGRV